MKIMEHLKKSERVLRSINFDSVDRVAIFESMHQFEVAEYYTGKKLSYSNYEDDLVIMGEAHQKCGIDLTCNFIAPMKPGIRVDDDGFIYIQEVWTIWLKERPFNDIKGLEEYIKKNIREVNNYKREEQWTFQGKTATSGIKTNDNYRSDFLKRQKLLGDVLLMHNESPVGLDTAWTRAGYENFVFLYYEKPELISEWLEALLNHEIKRVKDVADPELSPLVLVHADMADKNDIIFTKDFLKKEVFPRLKRLVDTWHEHDIKCIFHSDGNLNKVMDELVAAGIDAINPIEPDAKMLLKNLRSKFPKLVLTGGVDAKKFLASGLVEEIRKNVIDCINDAGFTGYLLGSSSEEILYDYKKENVIEMFQTAQNQKAINKQEN
jgi:hypothetical protein